jgi:chemotaxis-related protein WspD
MLFLRFQLGSDHFALPATRVVEVIALPELNPWPEAPKGLAGIFNYRGLPVPAVDLCELTAGRPAFGRPGTRVIVVRFPHPQGHELFLGLIAEQVTALLRKDPKEFHDPGLRSRVPSLGPICMEGRHAIQWLDERLLLSEPVSSFNRLLPAQPNGRQSELSPPPAPPHKPAKISTVLFRIQSEWLALPASAFQQVAEQRWIHSLPHRRHGLVLGLANVRGELLVCVSLGRLLGLPAAARSGAARAGFRRLLVAGWEENRFVFPVDEVHGLHRFQAHELKEPPATVAKSYPAFSQGVFLWGDGAAGFLDAERVFSALNQNLS